MVTISSYQNLLRFDAAPTEVQMKLGISQVLSMPFAYNSPVIVLDFEVGNKNIIKGRFKDAIRSRVFEFEIGDSITFKPFTWRRTDSDVDPMAWEDFSKGYCYRFDAVKTVRKEKPKCGNTSYNCGKACIGLNKNCKSDPPDKPSQEKVDKLRAAAGEFKAVQGDPTKKQEDNKLTPKPQEVKAVKTKTAKGAIAKSETPPKTPKTTRPKVGTKQYDEWLETESQKLKGKDGEYVIKTRSGDETVKGTVYGNGLGINPNKGSLYNTHSVTHIGSGRSLGDFDDEVQAKKALVELNRSGVNWSEQDLTKIPGIEKKIVKVKGLIDNAKDSDLRVKRDAKRKVIEEKRAKDDAKIEAGMQRFREEEAKKKQQAEIDRKIQEEKNKVEREKQVEAMKKMAEDQAKVYQDYEINRTNQLIGELKSSFDVKSLESEVSVLESRLKTESSPKAKKELNQRLNNANIKLKEVKTFLSQDKLETYPAFLKSRVKGMANTVGIEKTREILQEQIDNYKKQVKEEPKQKTIKVQGERSQEQESPLIPKEEIVKEAPKRIGDGTQKSSPLNAQEYHKMMVERGNNISIEEAEETVKSIVSWKLRNDAIRGDQQQGKPNKDADNIDNFIKNSTPYEGMVARGLKFFSKEEAANFIKGDENGILNNQSAHASWTSDFDQAKRFADVESKTNPYWKEYSENLYPVIVLAKNKTGVPAQNTGDGLHSNEAEVIVSKNTRHKVVRVIDRDGIILVETEEV
jgi:hypothetical protein